MVNGIVRTVCNVIGREFENVKIYDDVVEQGFETPCFCVNVKSVKECLFRDERYYFKCGLEIRYYGRDNVKTDGAAVMERLCSLLEVVDAENIGLVRGGNIKNEICKDYFLFCVEYEFFYVVKKETELMGKVKLELEI